MKLTIHSRSFDLTEAIAAHIRKQANAALSNFSDQVISVDVYLTDVNGPRGGADKRVALSIHLPSRLHVNVERTGEDLYAVVSQACRMAKRSVKRTLGKHRRVEKEHTREFRHAQSM